MAIRLTGIASGLDTDAIVSDLVSAYSYKVQGYEKQKTKMEWTQEAWSSLNKDVYSYYTKQLGTMRFQSAYSAMTSTLSNSAYASVSATTGAVSGTQTLTVSSVASSAGMTGKQLSGDYTSSTKLSELGVTGDSENPTSFKISAGGTDYTVEVTADTTLSGLASAIKNATNGAVTANFDATNGRFFLSASSTGEDGNFTLKADSSTGADLLSAIGFADGARTDYAEGVYTDDTAGYSASRGTNAKITLNGAEFTSSSNKFSINGLNITAQAEGTTSINTSVDSQAVYDKIKSALSEYNSLINNMTSLYNADSAKDYEPLTDEEKDAMSDTEIEKWEKKIKDSLLRRDSTLNSIISAMSTAMSKSYYVNDTGSAIKYNSKTGTYQINNKDIEYNGSTVSDADTLKRYASENGFSSYSLSSFGISTLGILQAGTNEQHAYHIDGDSDDTVTSSNSDKLLDAINNKPNAVMGFFSALFSDSYSTLGEKMSSSTLSSAYTIYNDKQMKTEMSEIEDTIEDWQEKLEELQDYWYSKFSAMETALAKLQSEQSSLASLLGS